MTTQTKLEIFIIKANKKHNNKYVYSNITDYKNCKTTVPIICPLHNEFYQRPDAHLAGQGCPKCSKNQLSNIEEFIEKATKIHKNNYKYTNIKEYKNARTKVPITCLTHGDFYQTPDNHLHGNGCPKCNKTYLSNNEKFIEKAIKIHNNEYVYTLAAYKNNCTKISIICRKHGIFHQTPSNHLSGYGCSECARQGKNEKLTLKFLEEILGEKIAIKTHKQFKTLGCEVRKHIYVDFYFELNNQKYIIEYNGKQHYEMVNFGKREKLCAKKEFANQQIRDEFLRIYCEENDIKLIEIDGRKYKNNKIKIFLENNFVGCKI